MRGLMLQGGGAKGAYEAGAIKALNERKIYFDIVGGTSIGAINAACYVTGNFRSMYKLWLSTKSSELLGIDEKLIKNFDNNTIKKGDLKKGFNSIIKLLKNGGVDLTNIKKFLSASIDEKKFRKSKVDYCMNTFSITDFKRVDVFKKDIPEGKLHEYILSSAYLPGFKLEKIIDDKYYLDGGVITNCPVDLLIDYGCDEVYVVKAWQDKIRFKNKRNIKVHIITPRENLGSILLFEKETAEYRMNLGYYDTIKYLDNLDGNKYYFKHNSDEYYNNLFDKATLKKMINEYNSGIPPRSTKYFVIKILEKTCKSLNINRFKVYRLPYLITRLKYMLSGKKTHRYYDFIKNIKVDFE